jgi:hypothetical protein
VQFDPKDEEDLPQGSNPKHMKLLRIMGILMTVAGIALFAFFINRVGIDEVLNGVKKIGWDGFAIILIAYLVRISARALSWSFAVYEPYKISFKDTLPAVLMGEAMSSLIPMGPIISGTTKVVAVKRKVPLMVGFSSITIENLFYTHMTGLFIIAGAVFVLQRYQPEGFWAYAIDGLIVVTSLTILFGIFVVIKQWHMLSAVARVATKLGLFPRFMEPVKPKIRDFEDMFFNFYRKHPERFMPMVLCQVAFHAMGIFEVWFILNRVGDQFATLINAFLLESVSRAINIFFKMVPFLVGVDEAGASFMAEILAIGATVGVVVAVVRKGRMVFWTGVGVTLIAIRNLRK